MNLKSQKGYSLLEIGVGLIIITIFMICGVTMLKGTYNTYRLVDLKNIALSYLIKGTEKELLDNDLISITDNPDDTTIKVNTEELKIIETIIPNNKLNPEYDMVLITTVETLPDKNAKSYKNSKVKLLTSTIEFYIRNGDPSSKRVLTLQTLKIGGKELGT